MLGPSKSPELTAVKMLPVRARRRGCAVRTLLLAGLFAMAAPLQAANLIAASANTSAESSEVNLTFDDAVKWRWFRLDAPQRVVIDVTDAVLGSDMLSRLQAVGDASNGVIRNVRVGQLDDGVRVVLDLADVSRQVSVAASDPKAIRVKLEQVTTSGAPAEIASAAEVTAAPKPAPTKPVTTTVQRPVVVVIDAGHGGKDSGAIGPTGLQEKHVALSIAREVRDAFAGHPGYIVKLTRDSDVFIPLRDRISIARQADADLFVSIHADAFDDRRAHGSSVYVLSNRGASSEYARLLARRENAADLVGGIDYQDKDETLAAVLLDISMNAAIDASADIASRVLGGMSTLGPLHKKSVQRAGFVVLKSPDVPSILVETAFISNPTEERNLGSRTHRKKIAQALVRGIKDYFTEYRPSGVVQVARADSLQAREHVVGSGDTLSAIADQYGISLRELRASNALNSDVIRVGQRLRIPIRTASR